MFWYIVGVIAVLAIISVAISFLKEDAPKTIKCVLACCALEGALLLIYFIMKWLWIFTVMKIVGIITVLLILLAVLITIIKR